MSSAAVSRCFSSTSSPSFNQHQSPGFHLRQRLPSPLSLAPNFLVAASVIVGKEEETLAGEELPEKSGNEDDETNGSGTASSLLFSLEDRVALVLLVTFDGTNDDDDSAIAGADPVVEGEIAVVLFVLRSVRSSIDGSVFVGGSRSCFKRGVGSDDAALARTRATGRASSRGIDSRFKRDGTKDPAAAAVPEAFFAEDTPSGIHGVTERGLRLLSSGQLPSSSFVRMVVPLLVVELAASPQYQSPIFQLLLLVWSILL